MLTYDHKPRLQCPSVRAETLNPYMIYVIFYIIYSILYILYNILQILYCIIESL